MPTKWTVVLVSILLATPVIIFWLWLMILPTSVTIQCPEECRCENDGFYVNCSGSGLKSIPSILPKHIRRFVLDHNNIPFFAKDNFVSKGLVELETIEANFCNIKKIEVGALNGLPKLTHLSVQGNQISEIIPGIFEKNFRLEYLHLANNLIEHLEVDVFSGLVNLDYILLQGNKLQYIHPDTFLGLPKLKILYFSRNYDLQIPTDRQFINSYSLKRLGISGCNTASVSVETFANVSALEFLDLSYNRLRSLDINILKVLPNLSVLNLTRNEISEIIPGTFEMVSHLKDLDLSHNRIEHLEFNVFYGLVNLKEIYLQRNNLQYLHPETFLGLPKLQTLILSINFGLQVPTDSHFINSHSLKHLTLSGCNIRSVSVETFANVTALELLDLSYNSLRSVDITVLKILPKLYALNLKSNEIKEIKPGTCEKISHLRYLYLENNIIEHLEIDVFCGFVNLKYIGLEGNRLRSLHPDTFLGLPNLENLNLSKNSGLQTQTDLQFINSLTLKYLTISGCNISSVSVETFSNVSELEQLDMSYNYLRILDINVVKLLPKLSHLNLQSNEIIDITPGICEKISYLEYLNLENNKIEHLESDVFCGFVNLKYINLQGNKLQYLNPDTFEGLQSFQSLFLSKNSGLQLPTDSNFINSLSLKHLALSGCNIRSVSVDTFANVSELEVLDLSYNYLESLDINILKVLPKLTHLYLKSNEINEIVPGVFGNNSRLEHLNLDNNKIKHLEIDVFYRLVNLKVIYLQENNLQHLHPETFLGLPKFQSLFLTNNFGLQIPTDRHIITSHSLKHLALSGCNINSVSVETFANVTALELLDLSYNYLMSLDISILKVLPKLSRLLLRDNEISDIIPGTLEISLLDYFDLGYNKIEHLGSDVFFGMVNLEYINLEFNKLQYLHPETFVGLPKLQMLILSHNYGLQIPTDRHFISSHFLKGLAIADCNVRSVSVETFANVSALNLIDLGGNNLKSLDISILKALPKLSEMYLYGNPLQCDCQLQEVWRWCKDHNIQTAQNGIGLKCVTPSEVKGLWWGVLEKGQCLQGNIHYCGDYKNTRYIHTQIEDTEKDTMTELETETEIWNKITSFLNHYKLPISAVLFIFGTIGNVIIIIIITCNKDMRTVPNLYILNLAISDIMYLSVLLCSAVILRATSLRLEIFCLFFPFCIRMSVSLSAYSIAVLSIQRYRVIVFPLQVRVSSQSTWRATGATICGMWIVAASFAVPSARTKYYCGASVFAWLTNYYSRVVIFRLLVSCVLPLCVIAFSYIMTYRHLLKSHFSASEVQNARQNTRNTTAKIVLGLTVVFLISYVPFHIYETYLNYSIDLEMTVGEIAKQLAGAGNFALIMSFLDILLSINSCLNPIALFVTGLAFRRHLKRYLNYWCKAKSPPNDLELARRN
jgi:insulin-like growth factor-binding protein complex acid labile subunit